MKIHFEHSQSPNSLGAYNAFTKKYTDHSLEECDVVLSIGGDGFLLETLHKLEYFECNKPVYGVNTGTIGFLANNFTSHGGPYLVDCVIDDIKHAIPHNINPLIAKIELVSGTVKTAIAFNDIYLNRDSRQAAKLSVSLDGQSQIEMYIGDGIVVSTEMGSTGYNRSAGGPAVPMGSNLTLVTPICGSYPNGWNGFTLLSGTKVEIENIEPEKRPLIATADVTEYKCIKKVTIERSSDFKTILMNPNATFNDKLINIQKGII